MNKVQKRNEETKLKASLVHSMQSVSVVKKLCTEKKNTHSTAHRAENENERDVKGI